MSFGGGDFGTEGQMAFGLNDPTRRNQQESRKESMNQRYSSLIHDSEVFLTKLREFKPQSLGCLEARRKSSSTLIFPNPPQACIGPPKCSQYPHGVKPTPGYWIECHGPGILGRSGQNGDHSTRQQIYDDSSISQRQYKASELKLIVDCSGRAGLVQHIPTTPTADMILTRHDTDLVTYQYEQKNQPSIVHEPTKRRLSANRINSTVTTTDSIDTEVPAIDTAGTSGISVHAGAATLTSDESSDGLRHGDFISKNQQQKDGNDDGCDDHIDQVEQKFSSKLKDQDNSYYESYYRSQETFVQPTKLDYQTKCSYRIVPHTKISSEKPVRKSGEARKKLSKRTMTRDDIDLHKTRRGTPNITITEPSFNQSTITYQATLFQKSITRQATRSNEVRRHESLESSTSIDQQEPTTRFPLQRMISCEAHYPTGSTDQDTKNLKRLDSNESDNNILTYEPAIISQPQPPITATATTITTLDLKPYKQQHRPSIIREDFDCELVEGSPETQPESSQEEHHSGLSLTTFQKKSYQNYQQQQQQQTNLEQLNETGLELISFEEENYEKHYYGREHWNYFTNDELLGPVMLSLKQEVNNQRDHFHVLLRTVSYTLHGTIPASTICADRYDREAIVRELSEIAKLKPPLMLGQLPSTPDELLKLDHIFIKTELKVGVIYIKPGQEDSEELILGNKEESPLFTEFLDLLGDRITLKGFDRYKGGLDTVHNLTGTESVYTMWRNIEIMFHVSTMLPHEENDPQKLQKKRHIGNDIVCVAFIESDDTNFWPGCIKSYFLHTFIAVRTSPKPLKEGEKRKYSVSCVCRNEVQYGFKPYLVEQDEFYKSDFFREWLLVKIVNGERASYSAPKFARMQDRTRSQLLEDIITNLANHLVTGQIPKPYRRGSWRPLGHTRASSPLEDSMKDYFEDYDQLAKDFCNAFCGPSRSMLCDVVFRVKDKDGSYKLVHGVRAIMAIRSRTFLEMLYGFVPPGTGPSSLQNQTNLRAIEMKALSGESSGSTSKDLEQTKSLLAKRGSVGADPSKKIGEKERRQSMLPNLSKSVMQKPNYLTVPNTSGGGGSGVVTGAGGGTGTGGSGTSGMIKNAFNRLVSGNWSGWSGNIKSYKGEPMLIKVDQNKPKVDLNSLAICKEIAKIDAEKLAQREFEIKEFDYDTFQQTIEYIHNGQCKLSYETIPGLICAAEHYDLPDLLHACFHHANTHMKLSAAPKMMNALYQNSCFYITAMQLLDSIFEYIDPHGNDFFSRKEYLELYESVFTTLLTRKTLQISELKKFQAMNGWTKQQIANEQKQKIQLQKQQSSEQDKSHPEIEVITEQSELDTKYKNLMNRLNKEVSIKLDKISNEDLVKVVLPTKVFSNDKIFDVMADESRNEY